MILCPDPSYSPTLSLTLSLAHSFPHTLFPSHTPPTLFPSHTLPPSHSLKLSLPPTHSFPHTLPHTLPPSHTLPPCHTLPLSIARIRLRHRPTMSLLGRGQRWRPGGCVGGQETMVDSATGDNSYYYAIAVALRNSCDVI